MQTKSPLVSVIMNCHNGEEFLNETLRSLKNQSYKKWELIFFDNNSKDQSISVVESLKDSRFKIFKQKKLINLYDARNLAVQKAKGKYVTFLDVDDLWSSNKLKHQVEFLQKNKMYKFCYSNYFFKRISKEKKIKFKQSLNSGKITQNLLDNYTIGILTVLMEKSIFINNKFNSKYNIIGDFDLFLKISLKNHIGYIHRPLATYRLHNNNYSNKNLKQHIIEVENWLYKNEEIFKKKGYKLFQQKIYLFKLRIKLILKKFLGV